MSKVTETVSELVNPILKENDLELWNVEFQKEGRDWFLRVYIDKSDPKEYISTDECELVSRELSEKLDKLDPIEQNYYLEVSSPGMDRELTKPEHFAKYMGEMVDVKLFKPLEGSKEYEGKLIERAEDGSLTIEVEPVVDKRPGKAKAKPEEKVTLLINSELIAKVSLAVIF